jgi:hypothetical protein
VRRIVASFKPAMRARHNFEVIPRRPTPRLHRAFHRALGYAQDFEDPSNRLLDVETQLGWLCDIGFTRRRLLLEVARDGAAHRGQVAAAVRTRTARRFRSDVAATVATREERVRPRRSAHAHLRD